MALSITPTCTFQKYWAEVWWARFQAKWPKRSTHHRRYVSQQSYCSLFTCITVYRTMLHQHPQSHPWISPSGGHRFTDGVLQLQYRLWLWHWTLIYNETECQPLKGIKTQARTTFELARRVGIMQRGLPPPLLWYWITWDWNKTRSQDKWTRKRINETGRTRTEPEPQPETDGTVFPGTRIGDAHELNMFISR